MKENKPMLCPTLSYNKPQVIGCYKEGCPFFSYVYGCTQAYNLICSIEEWEQQKKQLEKGKQELKARGDISIY